MGTVCDTPSSESITISKAWKSVNEAARGMFYRRVSPTSVFLDEPLLDVGEFYGRDGRVLSWTNLRLV